ncbi:MAG: DsrE family protein [Deltaproteobacteria bacterium]|jgi:predicted peroxiredoxin|nr:DsrE family protein [Deltaproteobacteria bacterium]
MSAENEKILIVQLADPEKEPEKSIASLIFARTLAVMENEIYIFSMARAPLLYLNNLVENPLIDKKFKDLTIDNLTELLKYSSSVSIYICSKSKELLSLDESMLIKPFQIAGMVTLHNLKQTSDHAYFF